MKSSIKPVYVQDKENVKTFTQKKEKEKNGVNAV